MDSSSAPPGKMCSCTFPLSRKTATAPSTRAIRWSSSASKGLTDSRPPTWRASKPHKTTQATLSHGRVFYFGFCFLIFPERSEGALPERKLSDVGILRFAQDQKDYTSLVPANLSSTL